MRVDLVETFGVFSLDGQDFDVENNVWLLGDDDDVMVVDPAHDAEAILRGVAERRVTAVVCTHGHNDHINAASAIADATGAPVALHPDDRMLWDAVHPERAPDVDLHDGAELAVGDHRLTVLHTPGHSPGCVCLYAPTGHLMSGDTLFQGGPGATGRSFSDFPTIIESIRRRLFSLPPPTVVLPGHGPTTTIGTEAPHLQEWIDRGH